MGPHPWIHKALLVAKELDWETNNWCCGAACSEALRLLRGRGCRGWVISWMVFPRSTKMCAGSRKPPRFPDPKIWWNLQVLQVKTVWDDIRRLKKKVLFWLLWFTAFADMSISGHPRLFTPTSMRILNSCRGPQHGAQGVFYICMMQMSKHSLMWHAIKV